MRTFLLHLVVQLSSNDCEHMDIVLRKPKLTSPLLNIKVWFIYIFGLTKSTVCSTIK